MPFVPANGQLTIDRLTGEAEIKIFTIAGELVKKLDYTGATGIAKWDGTNNAGKGVASGVYIALIKSPSGTKKLKIALEK
jgi:flagellar hook assembly protein FlgD